MPAGGLTRPPPPDPVMGNDFSGFPSQTHIDPLEDQTPTHVVGSQGRRGILPSAPGRAAAVGNGELPGKSALIPPKDADGKFPCPHCNKTYLHAKHLKRHLLRHTGDRPYMCVLCRDTFSRSDILKRHFQKCSLRRGNPTGASHLSHAQAHVKKHNPGLQTSAGSADDGDFLNGAAVGDGLGDTIVGHVATPIDGQPSLFDPLHPSSAPLSRRNSLKRQSSGGGRDRRSLTGPGPSGSNRASFDGMLTSLPLPPAPSRPPFSRDHSLIADSGPLSERNGGGLFKVSNESGRDTKDAIDFEAEARTRTDHLGWTLIFQPEPSFDTAAPLSRTAVDDRELSSKSGTLSLGFTDGLPQAPPNNQVPSGTVPSFETSSGGETCLMDGLPNWQWGSPETHPLQEKADQLLRLCCSSGILPLSERGANDADLKRCLSPDNIRHFAELFAHFQRHWPVIHMPTFYMPHAYDGLLLVIICIGAVYSDRVEVDLVRKLMMRTKAIIERRPRDLDISGDVEHEPNPSPQSDLERIQAQILLEMLFTWHGNQVNRHTARLDFAEIVAQARRHGMLKPSGPGEKHYSIHHQVDTARPGDSDRGWEWTTWVEQEKWSRVLFTIWLLDSALVMYFNNTPQFNIFEVRLPLPADDAAWDARSADECASALGLNGRDAQERVNVTGSRRLKQPEMHNALKALLHPTFDLRPRSTNVYSKFILIHALHVQIWNIQKQLAQNPGNMPEPDSCDQESMDSPSLGTQDWIYQSTEGTGDGRGHGDGSGNVTPVDPGGYTTPCPHQTLKGMMMAITKWKKNWDEDLILQYPPAASQLRRLGFCRDGVHFYWLARAFLRNHRALDWRTPPDHRFVQVLSLLKKVKQWVATDNAQRGEEIGSVGDIDESYGVEHLTLDMKLLFKPMDDADETTSSTIRASIAPWLP
ncbi:MAG: hypothetical protein M1817_006308 [Caeruleum heppii]|nr:MAG: hypothetical protein M1817_006308 [Caeruleum heppii]